MGGTTAKAAMLENGEPAETAEYEVGAGINLSSRLVKGGGYAIKLPFIDVSEIGAGGGSIVERRRPTGVSSVGPRSAGAEPGPVCYGRGGTGATLTDALVVLGYLNPSAARRRRVPLDAEAARRRDRRADRRPLGLPLLEAAHGVLMVAVATMTRAVKAVSTYRGRDPRDFALFAFGGNGPLVGVEIARAPRDATGHRAAGSRRLQRGRPALRRHRARVRPDAAAYAPTSSTADGDRRRSVRALERDAATQLAEDGIAAAT